MNQTSDQTKMNIFTREPKYHVRPVFLVILGAAIFTLIIYTISLIRLDQIAHLSRTERTSAATVASLYLGTSLSPKLNTRFEVPIQITSDNSIAGVDLKIIYNNTLITLDSIVIPQNIQNWSFVPRTDQNTFDMQKVITNANASGVVDFGAILFNQSTQKILETGPLNRAEIARLVFTAKKVGDTNIQFSYTLGSTTDTNVASMDSQEDVLKQVQDITVSIMSNVASPTPTASPTTTPTRSPSPTPPPTVRPSPTPTRSPSPTPTSSATQSPQPTATQTLPPQGQNTGLQFDGRNDRVVVSQAMQYMEDFTVEAFINPSRAKGSGIILAAGDDYNGWSLEIKNGKLEFWVADKNSTWMNLQHNKVLQKNRWYHVTATYNKGLVTLYVDGESSGTTKQLSSTYAVAKTLTLGGLQKYPHFAGTIDAVRVSTGTIYNQTFLAPTGFGVLPGQTVILYQFNEGTGQNILNDANKDTYNATLGNNQTGESIDPKWVQDKI